MSKKVFVVGVGMTKFEKPGARDWEYPDMGEEAGLLALDDARIDYEDIEQAFVGYCYGDSTCGQRAIYQLGMTGIPIYNVNNNCSTGSTALFMAKQIVEGGLADCVMALGFEKMEKGSLGMKYTDRPMPLEKHLQCMGNARGFSDSPMAPQMFGNAGQEHMERYGSKPEHFAQIAEKNHRHSVNNPKSQFRDEYTLEEILKARMIHEPLTKLQCCPTSEGAAAVIVCSEEFMKARGLQSRACPILGMTMNTDFESTFGDSCIKTVGAEMTQKAAQTVYEQSGYGPEDVQVIELHDCFSANELLTYEALGLCPEGQGGELIASGAVTYGGRWVVNPSGGLISKGHPLGATGLAQCTELTNQLRGEVPDRQVEGAERGLQHNLGLGGAAVVAMYGKPAA